MDFMFLRGMVIGFAIAAPVGPVGILCIRRALADGRAAAFIAGLGAALADTFYGAVAALGLTLISDLIFEHATPLCIGGGLFLCLLGARALRTPVTVAPPEAGQQTNGLMRDFLSTFVITMTNPGTIIAFIGVFAALGAFLPDEAGLDAGLLILGVFAGSAAWWFLLSGLAASVRERFSERWMRRINLLSGGLLLVFGIGVLAVTLF